MGGEADAGRAKEARQEGQKHKRGGQGGQRRGQDGTWKRKEKAESVLNDTQEIRRQFPEVKCAH